MPGALMDRLILRRSTITISTALRSVASSEARLCGCFLLHRILLNRDDAAHRQALQLITSGGIEAVTTVAVLLEVADAMASPSRRVACSEFLANLAIQPPNMIRRLDDNLIERSLALYRSRVDKDWSLTDCISFVVMKDEGLTEALTGDRHYAQAGFIPLMVS